MKITLSFAWYDLWVGVFIDRPKRRVYICPLPTLLITVFLKEDRSIDGNLKESPMQAFQEDCSCDKCSKGLMRPTGTVYFTHPAQYPHKCNNPECGYEAVFMFQYPRLVYKLAA